MDIASNPRKRWHVGCSTRADGTGAKPWGFVPEHKRRASRPGTGKMRQAATRELFAYWDRLRKGRAAPERAEIDPAAIRNVLADTFLLEIDPGCTFPIRLSGTRLNALWLSEQKGRSFLDLWADEERRCVAAMVLTVIDGVNP